MAMGRRKARQEAIWIATNEFAAPASHPFYERLNALLGQARFDHYCEQLCRRFYAPRRGRPSMAPGVYFRCLMIGYFEGIESERGIAWRVADSLGLRGFLGLSLTETTPDHSTISRTRRLLPVETHRALFRWVLKRLAEQGILLAPGDCFDAPSHFRLGFAAVSDKFPDALDRLGEFVKTWSGAPVPRA